MKILATVYKEFLLLVRDPGGMALIFIMPLALVIVMALVQDAPFRDYQEIKLEVLFIDGDQDSLSAKVKEAFQASPNVVLVHKHDTTEAKRLVQAGKFKAAIVLPKSASADLRRKTKQLITSVFSNFGFPAEIDSTQLPAINIKIFFDPAIKSNYKQALSGAVEKIAANVEAEWVLDELQEQLSEGKEEAPKKSLLTSAKSCVWISGLLQRINIKGSCSIQFNTTFPPGRCLLCFLFCTPWPEISLRNAKKGVCFACA